MEAYFFNSSSQDRSLSLSPSPYKHQIKNPMTKFNHPLISHPSENFHPLNSRGGFLHAPPPLPFLSHSFPPPVTSQYFHHHHHLRQQQQPPLLPLPIPVQQNYVNPSSRTRGLSCPPVNRKIKNKNPTRDQSLTPRKSSKPSKPTTVVPPKKPVEMVKEIVGTAINGLGPDPKDLPKVLLSNNDEVIVVNQADKFSGSVLFTLVSPPPSSLPLPTFSLRPKLSCKVEAAAGIDTGATDNLRRLLRLR